MVIVAILPHTEFGPIDHRKDAPTLLYRHFLATSFRLSAELKITINNQIKWLLMVTNAHFWLYGYDNHDQP